MKALTVGEIRKVIAGIPDDAPMLVHDGDGILIGIACIEAYEGCNGLPAVAIQLEEDDDEDEDSDCRAC